MTTDVFEHHRRLMFGMAYRMLGSVADAEDAVQDAWLRWTSADRGGVADPKAYLTRTVTNIALNRLRSAQVRREAYVGPWLPEPILTSPDVAEEVEMAESVSLAMLVVLETLSPLERAVFVLREVFGFSYGEIATTLERSEASVRQVGHRARSHVQARRPRFDASEEVRREVTREFLQACLGGDLNRVMKLLAPDVTMWSDGGGKVQAARRPIEGADKVARFMIAVAAKPIADPAYQLTEVNGQPGVLITSEGVPVWAGSVDVLDGVVTAIRLVGNPDKLGRLTP